MEWALCVHRTRKSLILQRSTKETNICVLATPTWNFRRVSRGSVNLSERTQTISVHTNGHRTCKRSARIHFTLNAVDEVRDRSKSRLFFCILLRLAFLHTKLLLKQRIRLSMPGDVRLPGRQEQQSEPPLLAETIFFCLTSSSGSPSFAYSTRNKVKLCYF